MVWRQKIQQNGRKVEGHKLTDGQGRVMRGAAGETVTPLHLEAGIAACHAAAPSWDATDWPQIVDLYDALLALTCSPVVAVNRAIAVSRIEGPLSGLAALDAVANTPALERYPLLPAIQAELWREAGDLERAAACYRAALGLARSSPEHRWLTARLSLLV